MKKQAVWMGRGIRRAGCMLLLAALPTAGWGEAMLQFFNANYREVAAKMPELAEAGYTSLWLGAPTKATSAYSMGYDLVDPFDIGGQNQRGGYATYYGTEADVHHLVEMAHRFGIRIYFDNIMNHRAYDVPGYNESTPLDVYPGMVPEDFHLRVTPEGFYRSMGNIHWPDWDEPPVTAWEVLNMSLSDLLDIAHETPNANFGASVGATHEKPWLVRQPGNPEFYDRMPNTNAPQSEWDPWDWSGNTNANLYVGFGVNNGITTAMLAEFPDFFKEDVGAYLCRNARWLTDRTKADGFRLDAVKHTPDYFFGQMDGEGKDASNAGYLGNMQWQFNMTRGFGDWDNHRDTLFSEETPRNDMIFFGEHLGEPPPQEGYIHAGMRLLDDPLRNRLNEVFGDNWLQGFDGEAAAGFGPHLGIMHAQSHDNDGVNRKTLHHAYYLTRAGIPLIYTDGNRRAPVLTGSGNLPFPRWALTDFLGQWGQNQLPELLDVHQNMAWWDHKGVWSEGNWIAYHRGRYTGDGGFQPNFLFLLNSGWDFYQDILTAGDYPQEGGTGADAYLYNYVQSYKPHRKGGNWEEVDYAYASELASGVLEMKPNSYNVWGYKNPDPSRLWADIGGDAVTFYDDGDAVDVVWAPRVDGPDGDPNFNPYGIDPAAAGMTNFPAYTYYMPVPRITGGTNVTFGIRTDGSAEGMMVRLDGGMDLNGVLHSHAGMPCDGDPRDNPPGCAHDIYLGFEDASSFFAQRIWPEKFAATNAANSRIGSAGATSYEIPMAGGVTNIHEATDGDNFGTGWGQVGWVYHNPNGMTDVASSSGGGTYTDTAQNGWPTAAVPGFGAWDIHVYGTTETNYAGNFVGDPANAGITMGAPAYGLYANPDISSGVTVSRGLAYEVTETPVSFSITLGVNWDAGLDDSYKGFEVYNASGAPIFGVNIGHSAVMYYYGDGGGTWSSNYGTDAFTISLTNTGSGYAVSGTTRDGGTVSGIFVANTDVIAGYKVYMNGVNPEGQDNRQIYFNNASYTTASSGAPEGVVTNQVHAVPGGLAVFAKMARAAGAEAYLYYTVDGQSWPEGAAGYAAARATRVVPGVFRFNGDGGGDWWSFTIPNSELPVNGTLRYKIGAARRQGYGGNGWETVWPGSADAVAKKQAMLSQWMVGGQNLKTKSYRPHNDYGEIWTGLKDGFHLLTARAFVARFPDEPPLFNTFRRTFYLDTETPRGYIQYPASDGENVGDSEYGVIVRTDNTVQEVWYHITDASTDNDGAGNGLVSNEIVWAQATKVGVWSEEQALSSEYPQVWRFNYDRIPPGGQNAVIHVRLCEVSTAPVPNWSKANTNAVPAEHYTQLTRRITANGPAEEFFFAWPGQDREMVEAGWSVRLQFTPSMLDGASAWADCFQVYINATNNGSTLRGALYPNEEINLRFENGNQMLFDMPNVYNGVDNWLYGIEVAFSNGAFSKTAVRLVQHRGPMLPTVVVAEPLEVDSDGVPLVIRMKDTPEAATNAALRETPIRILTDAYATNVTIRFTSPSGYVHEPVLQSVVTNSTKATWTYVWTLTNPGTYRFEATVMVDPNSPLVPAGSPALSALTNTATRKAVVQFRQLVDTSDPENLDWDDDGILNADEITRTALPARDAEQWTQAEIHLYHTTGRTLRESPDSDGDGLPDALELGYRAASTNTDVLADTNADGWLNFLPDWDPPFYNAVENANNGVPNTTYAGQGGDRTALAAGSVTDPNNPDTDYDGLPDGLEDANRNGWVDGDGEALPLDWQYRGGKTWPNGRMDMGEIWEESAPGVADSDGDGLSDGYGEDVNLNGRTDLFLLYDDGTRVEITPAMYGLFGIGVDVYSTAHSGFGGTPAPYTSRAIDYAALFGKFAVTAEVFTHSGAGPGSLQSNGWPRILITETDPLNTDTDGDGMPDGWENRYGLDPLDNGAYNLRTGQPGNPENGPDGNPDGDTYLNAQGTELPYTNLLEYQNNTHPRQFDPLIPDTKPDSIHIGQGGPIGVINGVTNYHELLDWRLDDLLALDDYDSGGDQSDIFIHNDGFDSSRDLIAFYFRDGGHPAADGDDKLYFRVDLDDLRPYAEEHHLNVFVAINWRGYGNGEVNFPEEVDAGSYMGWNAVVAVYDSGNGMVYVDTDTNVDTTDIAQDLSATGVVSMPDAYHGAYFNSELDAIVFSINRSTLVDAGWVTGDADSLLFQVYTTRDYTANTGGEEGGAQSGDQGGRNDFCDLMGDDWLASSYGNDQNYISKNSYYRACISRTSNAWPYFNHVGKHIKVALLSHGNQAIEAAHTIQNIVDNGSGAGYQRPIKIHNIYTNAPLNLHITPTLAMALEWAEAGTTNTWFSGPALNEDIRQAIQRGGVRLLGSTFSDHIIRYFNNDYNRANVALAQDILNAIYGDGSATNPVVSTNVFWTPERVLDADSLQKVMALGYKATIYDQNTHLFNWYGRSTSLGDNAYKIHRFWKMAGADCNFNAFTIANAADAYRFQNTDRGLALEMRHLFTRRARGDDGQVATIFYMWEDLAKDENADAYDRSLRWMANHPWIQLASLDDTLDAPREDWQMYWIDFPATNSLQAQDWVQHASNEDYDNWYFGSDRHEGLSPKRFELRAGATNLTPQAWGSLANGGILSNAWAAVQGIQHADVKRLAYQTLFASTFETAFHIQENSNPARWSFGEYMEPASGYSGLQGFAWKAQGQTRKAALYAAVDDWARRTLSAVEVLAADVDLDGEEEYILRNNSIMALFERSGGRMVGAWHKAEDRVYQMIGNFASQPEHGWEDEGASNAEARRTSALKDWAGGASNQVNVLYTVNTNANSITFTNNGIAKTITLAGSGANAFQVAYTMPGKTLTVRNGFSPDLNTLLLTGQKNLVLVTNTASRVELMTLNAGQGITAALDILTGAVNPAASDQYTNTLNTVNLRNQAQTHQVEVVGTNALAFNITLGTAAYSRPVITFTPAGPYTMPVGYTNNFTVTATNAAGAVVPVTVDALPEGATFAGGVFTWAVTNQSWGNRQTDLVVNVTFNAADGMLSTSETAQITIPWDANNNLMGDDWEFLRFGGVMTNTAAGDADGDGFPNYSEWIAGTHPTNSAEYIGWESLFRNPDGTVELTFQCVPFRTYYIETSDPVQIIPGNWTRYPTPVISGNTNRLTWVDTNTIPTNRLHYRLAIPRLPTDL